MPKDPFALKGPTGRMPKMDSANEEITRRLDLLIFLHLDERFPSVTEKITKLAEAGLNSSEIGRFVGKKANYVTAILSQRNKRGGSSRRKDA
jgi:hypothetical protein